jgi:hypothetical protein
MKSRITTRGGQLHLRLIQREAKPARYLIEAMAAPTAGWIRIFGKGIAWKDLRYHRQLFSERTDLKRTLRIGHHSFKTI